MKRFFAVFLIVILCSCSSGGGPIPVTTDPLPDMGDIADSVSEPAVTTGISTEAPVTEPPVTEPPAPVLPKLSFFLDDLSDTFAVIDSYKGTCVQGRDVGCFGIIPAVDGVSEKSYKSFWGKGWEDYPELEGMKLGYLLEFYLTGGEKVTVATLCPEDTEAAYNKYLEVYIYDDVNQIDGQWYSHLLKWQMKDETIITSVKLTGGAEAYKVDSIVLTAYLYDSEGQHYSVTELPIKIIK